jgi:hypothetical protein
LCRRRHKHDLRHTYASLARRAVADLRLLQKSMGHASITVTAHIFADLYDYELDVVASALDAPARLSSPNVWPYFGVSLFGRPARPPATADAI